VVQPQLCGDWAFNPLTERPRPVTRGFSPTITIRTVLDRADLWPIRFEHSAAADD